MKHSLRNLILAAAMVFAAAQAGQAAQIAYLRDAAGGDGPFRANSVVSGAGYINTWNGRAGTLEFEMSLTGVGGTYFNLLTYCGDPFRALSVGPVNGAGYPFALVSMQDFGYGASDIVAIEKLWALAFADSLTSATKAAAFQFLLWEFIADPAVDLTTGIARVTNTNVKNQAQTWANQLANATARASLRVLDGRASNRQSFFLEETPIHTAENPEPATFAMLGAGLIGLVYFRRKR